MICWYSWYYCLILPCRKSFINVFLFFFFFWTTAVKILDLCQDYQILFLASQVNRTSYQIRSRIKDLQSMQMSKIYYVQILCPLKICQQLWRPRNLPQMVKWKGEKNIFILFFYHDTLWWKICFQWSILCSTSDIFLLSISPCLYLSNLSFTFFFFCKFYRILLLQ